MKIEIQIPEKYGEKLAELEEVDPNIRDQIEVEVLPEVLRLINDGHRQLQESPAGGPPVDPGDDDG